MKRRKFISVSCPECDFNNGGFYEGDITPTRSMSFTCRRDRYYDEEKKRMFSSPNHCGNKWDIAVTEEQYEKIFADFGRRQIISKLYEELDDSQKH